MLERIGTGHRFPSSEWVHQSAGQSSGIRSMVVIRPQSSHGIR